MAIRAKGDNVKGHINFRLPPERHEELLEVARYLGIDLTALLNEIIVEALPAYLEKARRMTEARSKARAALDEAVLTADHPLVRELVRVGRPASKQQRLAVLLDVALKQRRRGDPPLEETVRAALRHLDDEDLLQEIRAAIEDAAARGP